MNLPGTFVEGVEAVAQPCTVPLLLSGLVFVLAAGRRAPLAAVAHLAGAALVAWTRFARLWTTEIAGATAVAAGAIVAAAVMMVVVGRVTARTPVAAGAAFGGALAAAAWQPCVGPRLADIVNGAADDRLGSFVPTATYLAGIGFLALVVAAIPVACPRVAAMSERLRLPATGAVLGVVLGLLMAIGIWSDLAEELLRRSTV